MERPICQAKILAAINNMASGKAPGYDGFSINFYETFSSKLVDKLQKVFNEATEVGQLPESTQFSLMVHINLTKTSYIVEDIVLFHFRRKNIC